MMNGSMIDGDDNSPSGIHSASTLTRPSKWEWEGTSRTRDKTGTRTSVAIEILFGELHSSTHDLDLFFWMLLRTCVHYNQLNKSRVNPRSER